MLFASRPLVVVLLASAACESMNDEADLSGTEASTDSASTTGQPGSDLGSGTSGAIAVCGDGIVGLGEHCDGNPLAGVECPESCAFPPRTELWRLLFDGEGRPDGPAALAFDDAGGIVIGGESGDANGNRGLIVRVSEQGELLGATPWELPTENGATSVAAAGDDVIAMSNDGGSQVDIARFDHAGMMQWSTSYSVADPTLPTWGANVVTQEEATVLFGTADLGSESPGFIVTFEGPLIVEQLHVDGPRYDPVLELTSFSGFFGQFLDQQSVVLTGSVVIAGGRQAWMQRRRLPDSVEWEVLMDSSSGSQVDTFTAPAVGLDGTIAVGWNRHDSDDELDDMWVGKFSPTGEVLWSDTYVGEYHRDDYPVSVAVDPDGRVFVIGTRSNDAVLASADYDIVLLEYSADGQREWVDVFTGDGIGGGQRSWDYAGVVGFHPSGFVVACGRTMTPEDDYDVICRALAP